MGKEFLESCKEGGLRNSSPGMQKHMEMCFSDAEAIRELYELAIVAAYQNVNTYQEEQGKQGTVLDLEPRYLERIDVWCGNDLGKKLKSFLIKEATKTRCR